MQGFVFAMVILWKITLLITTAQPIPFSDAFFYDGPVVNLLNGGSYTNPALELVLPISATKVFSAYPPLYQFTLWIWMCLFGSSALSAMWLHLVLFVSFGLALLVIFQHLKTPANCVNIGCLFLFGITFHDRPDSLAFALGTWAIYLWLRAIEKPSAFTITRWHWCAATLNVLTLTTSLQLGMMFFGWSVLLVTFTWWFRRQSLPWLALFAVVAIPATLVFYVKSMQQGIWTGFLEHLHETPSLLGMQASNQVAMLVSQIFKLGRYTPAVFLALVCIGILLVRSRFECRVWFGSSSTIFLAGALAVGGGIILVTTVFLVLVVHWLAYLQIPIVACTIHLLQKNDVAPHKLRLVHFGFLGLALLVGSRAIGMSTWGIANSCDVNYFTATQRVHSTLEKCVPNSTVVASSAFLYEANSFQKLRSLHVDWLSSYREPSDRSLSLITIKPQKLVLTQFDWYRCYEPVIVQLEQRKDFVEIIVHNDTRTRPPDAYPQFQKLLQHTSWSPVIVELLWKTNINDRPASQ